MDQHAPLSGARLCLGNAACRAFAFAGVWSRCQGYTDKATLESPNNIAGWSHYVRLERFRVDALVRAVTATPTEAAAAARLLLQGSFGPTRPSLASSQSQIN